ncbi:MAG TPA: hypothetical protein VKM35_03270 [Arenimonas sp.]|uniref:hypothetical protein n=1 Tax=Arenimonas sp. TaxID=1872635 RepID=UPI002BEA65AB|nr:hypothetical protein [Arenimonas sp.]HMB56208.1 hypothetical protein [Arenimonas sp.]
MNFSEVMIGAYHKLQEAIANESVPHPIGFLKYEHTKGESDFVYDWQESDFTRELVNTFNKYAYWLTRAQLWERILEDYSEDEALEIRYEFTDLQLDWCLHFPYKFKSKIIFCATQLCYVKAIAGKLISRESVKGDDQITLGVLSEVATHWISGAVLIKALRDIDGEVFRDATDQYRNKAQHRNARRLDFGHISNIVRSFPKGSVVRYGLGDSPPILTRDVLPALIAEAEKLRFAFNAYRELVDDHVANGRET